MSGTIIETENNYEVAFPFNPRMVDAIKRIPGRYFKSTSKSWVVPKTSRKELEAFSNRYGIGYAEKQAPENYAAIPPLPELTIDIPMKYTLFPFQKNGVAYALEKKRMIIGDQMGLGKTITAIATLVGAEVKGEDVFPCLVIAPSSMKHNWKKEWEDASYKKALVLSDNCRKNFHLYYEAGMGDVFITNFESLKKYFVRKIEKPSAGRKMTLKDVEFHPTINFFKSIIVDESHRVKSTATQQTKFTKGIAQGKKYILLLTGTPVVNNPKDLVSQLGICDRFTDFGGYKNYMMRYCGGSNGATNLKELNYRLNLTCFFRRDKEKVLTDLPPKTRQVVLCDISTRHEYNEALHSLQEYLRKYKEATDAQIAKSMRGEVMVRIGVLKNISARGKMKEVCEFVNDLIENEEKLIMFAYLREIMAQMKEHYPDAVFITGAESDDQKENAKHDFQKCKVCDVRFEKHAAKNINGHEFVPSDTKLIVCNYRSAGVGHTLTASSRVAFIEIPWTAADCDQCEDRAHRMSQQDNVTCTYFLGRDTIDEWLYDIVRTKRDIADTVTGTETHIEEQIIDKMWNLFNQEK